MRRVYILPLVFLASPLAAAGPAASAVSLSGLVDVRYARTSQQRGWLDGGAGKFRYGGSDLDANGSGDRDAHALGIPQASVSLDAELPAELRLHAQTNFKADTGGGSGIGVVEAFLRRRWVIELGRFEARAGGFIPPVSREHTRPAWSTRHTVTPSAIGSWIAEEVRAFGLEGSWARGVLPDDALNGKITAGVFAGSDGSGRLLLYRGWALHDYQAHLAESLPAPFVGSGKPFSERDGRAGFYARSELSALEDRARVFSGYWDNAGDHGASPPGTSGADEIWNTRFWDGGLEFESEYGSLIGHYLKGESASRSCPRWSWSAWYALASARLGDWTLSGRYDRFEVNHRKFENGYALTAGLSRRFGEKQTVSLEYLYGLARPSISVRPASRKDQLAQINYRLRWGE